MKWFVRPCLKRMRHIHLVIFSSMVFLSSGAATSLAALPFFRPKTDIGQYSQREAQINEYNERAIQYFEEGRFKEAQEYWEKAIAIMESSSAGVEAEADWGLEGVPGEEELGLEEDGDALAGNTAGTYETAVSLFKKEKYVAAKNLFERVESTVPDYKATRNYLSILAHKIKRQQQTLAGGHFQDNAQSRREERAEWNRILAESETGLRQKMMEQAEPLYQDALAQYKARNFKVAKGYFSEVANIISDYKDTSNYLSRIDQDIRDDENRALEEQRKKELLARKKEQEEWQRILVESEQQLQKKLVEQAEPIYQEALEHYRQRRFRDAKSRFEEVAMVIPGYKSTDKYMERIDRDIKEDILISQKQRALDLERERKEEEAARKRAEEDRRAMIARQEEERLSQFQQDIAARRKERDEWVAILEASERERDRKLKEQAEEAYREALQYYQSREFAQAKETFREVEHIYPNYKSTQKYLARIDEDIKAEHDILIAEKQRALRRGMREQELAQQRQKEHEKLLRAQDEENRLMEQRERALAREKQRQEWTDSLAQAEVEHRERLEKEADFVYQEAVKYFNDRQWERARERFIETEQIQPGFRKTEDYLARIDAAEEESKRERERVLQAAVDQKKRERELVMQKERELQDEARMTEEKIRAVQKEKQAEAVYKFAMSLYRQKDYAQARQKFLEVETIFPGYKGSDKYLKQIAQDIAKAERLKQHQQEEEFARLVKEQRVAQKKEEERLERIRLAEEKRIADKIKLESQERQREREEWERSIAEIEAAQQRRLAQQTESLYQEALHYYNAGWYGQAKDAFEEVEVSIPNFKATRKYIASADQKIQEEKLAEQKEQQRVLEISSASRSDSKSQFGETQGKRTEPALVMPRQEAIAEELYKNAYQAYKSRDYLLAKEKFSEVERVIPAYKSTNKYLKSIDMEIAKADERLQAQEQAEIERIEREQRQALKREERQRKLTQDASQEEKKSLTRDRKNEEIAQSMEKAEQEHLARLRKQARPVYDLAVKAYKEGDLERARTGFIEVEQLLPGYKATEKYLAGIESRNRSVSAGAMDAGREPGQRTASSITAARPVESREDPEIPDIVDLGDLDAELLVSREPSLPEAMPVEAMEPPEVKKAVQDRKQKNAQLARAKYNEAVDMFKAKRFTEAKLKFIEVEALVPDYRSTGEYLVRVDDEITKQQDLSRAEVVSERGAAGSMTSARVSAAERDDRERAETVNQALMDLERNARSAVAPLPAAPVLTTIVTGDEGSWEWEEQIKRQRRQLAEQRKKVQREYQQQFLGYYNKAVALYKSRDYQEAYELFTQIERLSPGYKKTQSYLTKITAGLYEQKKDKLNAVVQLEDKKSRQDAIKEALDGLERRM